MTRITRQWFKSLKTVAAVHVVEFSKYLSPISFRANLPNSYKKVIELPLVWAIDTICHLPRADLEQYQLGQLNKILKYFHSQANPSSFLFFYNQYRLQRLEKISNITKLPILTRQQLDSFFKQFPERFRERFLLIATSGSSGVPLHLYFSKKLFLRRIAAIPYEMRVTKTSGPLVRLNFPKESYYAWHGAYIDPYQLGKMDRIAAGNYFERIQPKTLLGTVSHVLLLAEFFDQISYTYPFQAIFVTGEHLLETQRKYLERILGGKCYRVYGCNEFGHIGQECIEQYGIHINEDWILLEILKENSREASGDESGEVVITSLHNIFPPIIRYRLGDQARPLTGICPCGLSTRRILLEGRTADFIHLPNGDRVSLIKVLELMSKLDGLKKYQFIQHSTNFLEVRVVLRQRGDQSFLTFLEREVRKYLSYPGPDLKIVITSVKAIKPSPQGKAKILSTLQ